MKPVENGNPESEVQPKEGLENAGPTTEAAAETSKEDDLFGGPSFPPEAEEGAAATPESVTVIETAVVFHPSHDATSRRATKARNRDRRAPHSRNLFQPLLRQPSSRRAHPHMHIGGAPN